jgi:diguanylate cyclase (GGDEF)-like protein
MPVAPWVRSSRPETTPPDDAPSGVAILVGLVRLIGIVAFLVGLVEAVAGIGYHEPRAVALGGVAIVYGIWVATRVGRLGGAQREATVTWIATMTLGLVAVASLLQPSIATAMAIASLLPAVIVTPLVSSRVMLRLLIGSGMVGAWSVVVGAVAPSDNRLPDDAESAIAFITLVLAYAFLIMFLWEVSRRLKTTAADLQSVVRMSGDLAKTLDPRLVGDRIAVHIARAVGADDCALSYWDRATNRVITLGYEPPERRAALNETYAIDDYPATMTVLEAQRATIVNVDDPTADQAEVRYLASIGHRSMAMIPLIAAGRTIVLIEVTAARQGAFGPAQVELATMLAGEAAMALENARLYDQIRHQALHDGLTGLANRVLFRDRVEHAVERIRRSGGQLALLFIDLNDLKTLNDHYGHARGDEALAAVAERPALLVRPADTAARVGGDEFSVLLEDVESESDAVAIATRIAESFRQPLFLEAGTFRVAASIGVAMGAGEESADELLRNADVAMYAAKQSSRGGTEVFQPGLRDRVAERTARAERLRGVEERDELRLDYQPIVELTTGSIVGVEALVRWQPPDGPVLMPGEWIDLAEETRDIVPIGRWILREACRQARDWQIRLGRPDLRMSVNLSARQFLEHDVVSTVQAALDETGLTPSSLMLEITESGLMRRTQATIARLASLREIGVHLAIDDFGTGYSSLSYLERFPIDILKIDRTFVSEVGSGASPIARAVIDLGRTLNLEVIAEGIEHAEQARLLAGIGCRYGQGFLFARPVSAAAIEAMLAEGEGLDAVSSDAANDHREPRRLRLVSGE